MAIIVFIPFKEKAKHRSLCTKVVCLAGEHHNEGKELFSLKIRGWRERDTYLHPKSECWRSRSQRVVALARLQRENTGAVEQNCATS